jgi:hypothetical protein
MLVAARPQPDRNHTQPTRNRAAMCSWQPERPASDTEEHVMFTIARTTAAVLALTAVLAGCDTAQSAPGTDGDRLGRQAQTYADPWEKRFRVQFWTGQHVHDSWNPCHLGENAARPRGCDGRSLTPR